jgi:hypothetical protein
LQQHPSPSQSPFQQDVLLLTNNNQHFINTFTTQEQVSFNVTIAKKNFKFKF